MNVNSLLFDTLNLRNILTLNFILMLIASYSLIHVQAKVVLNDPSLDVKILTQGLSFPTGMAFLNSNEILVSEKDAGRVVRVVNGNISNNPVLTVDINHHKERGLLGIALPRDSYGDDRDSEDNPKYVFLFYTEPIHVRNEKVSSDPKVGNCKKPECLESQFSNRLYRYEYKHNKLINPKLLIDIPIYWNNWIYPSTYSEIINGGSNWLNYPLIEGIHQGGKLLTSHDNTIFLVTGDGGGCRNSDGCHKSIKNGFLRSKTANKIDGASPIGIGGILHVTNEGNPVDDKGVIGDEAPLNMYYGYGIRNSFGMDLDPVTGKLWDTENGPHFGDEINLVEPGFNSGWAKMQGVWPISNYTDLYATSSEIGYVNSSTIPTPYHFEDFDGKGEYSDPEFTWNSSVGVTSIKFLDTKALGKQYENDILVGDSYGTIYHFDLNEDRTGLKLNGSLADKVANSISELSDSIFAQGLNTITDIEVGPDAYIYVLSYSGEIYKIGPKVGNG